MSDKILLRFNEAAERLGLGRSTIYNLVARGELKTVNIGRSVRIPASELQRFVERQQMEATHAA